MPTYVFILQNKRRGEQTTDLLEAHVDHLKRLSSSGNLVICGPFADNDGAIQILRADNQAEATRLFEADPFIKKGYYQDHQVFELYEASAANNWLMDSDQTKSNLKS